MTHVFGPVPSRRLGRSLGVDLVPYKTCSYDCVYCQLGRTTDKTVVRREYVPLDDVVADLVDKLPTLPDYITMSGSGEPTLYSRLGELIERIHGLTDIPVAVLTNGSLLWDPEVRAQVAKADLVVPSLDAGSASLFRFVNRPHPAIDFEQMVDGLVSLRRESKAEYWLEVFILGGYTSLPTEARRIARIARKISPDRVQLNTVTRPPAEDFAAPVDHVRLEELAAFFDPPAEVIADYRGVHDLPEFGATRADVLDLISRRPCSLDDVAEGLGLQRNEAIKHIEALDAQGLLEKRRVEGRLFYSAVADPEAPADRPDDASSGNE
jgi:wyosine [tRNA(Phe)-imidazoG37] synthetase (radical SAM superfamily)